LSDYRTQFRIQGDNNARILSSVYFHGDINAIQDGEKRMEFGLYYCMEGEYKIQFRGSERPVVCQMLSYLILYAVHDPFIGKFQGFREIFE
jgi:hypothetical protein